MDRNNQASNQENQSNYKHKKKKRKIRLGYRWILIAMILALLFLLQWNGLHFGGSPDSGRSDGDTNQSISASNVQSNDNNTTDETNTVETSLNSDEETRNMSYLIAVRGESIFAGQEESLQEVSLDDLKAELSKLKDVVVTIRDEGAINKVYEQVVALVDSFDLEIIETAK